MIHIKHYQPQEADTWNRFIMEGKNATFLFHRDFMDYHADRFTDHSLVATNDKGQWIGVLPANLAADHTLISHQGLSYGGLVTRPSEKLVPTICILRAMLAYLHNAGITQLRYKALPDFYSEIPAQEYRYALFLLKAEWYRCDTALAIVNRGYNNRAVSDCGLQFAESEQFMPFWEQVLSPNLQQRYGVAPVHNLPEIELLKGRFPAQIRQFNAFQNETLVAGMTIFETPRVAHAQYIAANETGKSLNALKHLLRWLLAQPYRNHPVFDLGICNEQEGYALNQGLLDWKERLGGRTYTHDFFRIPTANYALLDAFCDKA
jgi:hypothetical protein